MWGTVRTIDEGAVGFRSGRIDYVGYGYGVRTPYDTVIDAAGKQVYPGLILPDNTLGLQELELVRATLDFDETGEMEPEVRTLTSFKCDSRLIPTVRSNGVLVEQVTPRGGIISGTSAVVQLDAWDWEDAVIGPMMGTSQLATRVHTGRLVGRTRRDGREKSDERMKGLDEIRRFYLRSKAYLESAEVDPVDLRMNAMRGLFDGTQTLYVHADLAQEIQEAVLFAKELGIKRVVIVGGYDAWRVADLLRDHKVDVILRRVHSLPLREDDEVDLPYRLPALLKERGIRFCLAYSGDHEPMVRATSPSSRALPPLMGSAARKLFKRSPWTPRGVLWH
jgi:imidazolonepropionase-like amidohydrolase